MWYGLTRREFLIFNTNSKLQTGVNVDEKSRNTRDFIFKLRKFSLVLWEMEFQSYCQNETITKLVSMQKTTHTTNVSICKLSLKTQTYDYPCPCLGHHLGATSWERHSIHAGSRVLQTTAEDEIGIASLCDALT